MTIDDAIFAVLDTETSGLDPKTEELLEIAVVMTSLERPNLGMFTTFVRPTKPLSPEVRAVHHLSDRELRNAPTLDDAIEDLLHYLGGFSYENAPPVIAAHNAEFDRDFMGGASAFFTGRAYPWLCTKRLALHLYADAPNFKNQTLRYYHGLDVDTLGLPPHRALADALVTAANLRFEIGDNRANPDMGDTIESLIDFVNAPALLRKIPLGKHRGPIPDVPTDYIQWALSPRGMTDMDKDLRFTLETELFKRLQGAA